MSPQEASNQRVTNALLAQKIDHLAVRLKEYTDRAEEWQREHVIQAAKWQDDHENRLRSLEATQRTLKERLAVWAGIQTLLSAGLAAIAGWIGARN